MASRLSGSWCRLGSYTTLAITYFPLVLGALADIFPRAVTEIGTSGYGFDLGSLSLSESRWQENQERTLSYLKFVDSERLLYVHRANHNLSTEGALSNGGWDAPDWDWRGHIQGHFLTAWTQCYTAFREKECYDKAIYLVEELAKCQANNKKANFTEGYLGGVPESDFTKLEEGTLETVLYYSLHKVMAGLLDVWRYLDSETARDVLLGVADWVDWRTGRLSEDELQTVLKNEFGGMPEVLADIYHHTGDDRWLTVANRFYDHTVLDPFIDGEDELNGLHANTQIPKWIGAIREYKATGNNTYLEIARNAWDITVKHHSYAIGANSRDEHFDKPDEISENLEGNTAEGCNSYNMLKLTRELWSLDPSNSTYFDVYENILLNHLLGQQNPKDPHGHITYYTPLAAGGRRGVSPSNIGGSWSNDYETFSCCQGTALETNTKLMDSIYFNNGSALFVNQFIPSTLEWSSKNFAITQKTDFPASDKITIEVNGNGHLEVNIRIPSWTSAARLKINGKSLDDVNIKAGSYAIIDRDWKSGDFIEIQLPMTLRTVPTNDNSSVIALAYGPTILCGNFGNSQLDSLPELDLASIKHNDKETLDFTATANGNSVDLGPFYDGQGFNYNVYWVAKGELAN